MTTERVYFGRGSFRVAAELIALFNPATCERVAAREVKRRAFRADPGNAAEIVFWASVLAQSRSLRLAELATVRAGIDDQRRAIYTLLERRSRAQHQQRAGVPVTDAA